MDIALIFSSVRTTEAGLEPKLGEDSPSVRLYYHQERTSRHRRTLQKNIPRVLSTFRPLPPSPRSRPRPRELTDVKYGRDPRTDTMCWHTRYRMRMARSAANLTGNCGHELTFLKKALDELSDVGVSPET